MSTYDINSRVGPAIITGPLSGTGVPVIDMRDFPYLTEAANSTAEPDTTTDDTLFSDQAMDYTELIREEAFVGTVPYETIKEGIEEQFNNYIGTEDHTNYVETFYQQLKMSFDSIDDEEEHPQERREALNQLVDEFVSMMGNLFETHLAIVINDLEGEDWDYDDLEYEITVLYNYFIMNARENFRTVIVRDITRKMQNITDDDREYYKQINDMLRYYSPLIIAMGPMEFLRMTKNDDICEMFEDGRVSGNFLKRYSPRFFQFEDFEADIVAEIVMKQEVRDEILTNINK